MADFSVPSTKEITVPNDNSFPVVPDTVIERPSDNPITVRQAAKYLIEYPSKNVFFVRGSVTQVLQRLPQFSQKFERQPNAVG